jgi:hypothetical protein
MIDAMNLDYNHKLFTLLVFFLLYGVGVGNMLPPHRAVVTDIAPVAPVESSVDR